MTLTPKRHRKIILEPENKPPLLNILGACIRQLRLIKPELPTKEKSMTLNLGYDTSIKFSVDGSGFVTKFTSFNRGEMPRWIIPKCKNINELIKVLIVDNHYNFVMCTQCAKRHSKDIPYCTSCGSGDITLKSDYEFGIHDYNYVPSSYRFKEAMGEKVAPYYMGIELEIDAGFNWANHNLLTSKIANIAKGWLYFKRDGSLNNGFEIVTHPVSFNFLLERKDDIKLILEECIKHGYTSFHNDTCGMHIHVSRCGINSMQIPIIYSLLQENKKVTNRLICRREFKKIKRWCNYQIPKNTIDNKAKIYGTGMGDGDKYSALNVNKRNTVEFRIFKGTLGINGFYKNIETVHSLIEYTKTISINDASIKDWFLYVERHKEIYPHLNNNFHNNNMLLVKT